MTTTAPWHPATTPNSTPPAPVSPAHSGATALSGTAAEQLVVLVAPANGRFRPAISEGSVQAGDVVAHLSSGQGRRVDVHAPVAVTLRGLLTRPGQLVLRGQALAWAVAAEGAAA